MRITVHYLAQLKRLTGTDQQSLEIDGAATLAGLLQRLATEGTEEIRRILLHGPGRPHPSLLVFLGDEQVPSDSVQPLHEGDVVTLLTPMAGG